MPCVRALLNAQELIRAPAHPLKAFAKHITSTRFLYAFG
jgi:hypothetical protein